jgi:hypothetical protein
MNYLSHDNLDWEELGKDLVNLFTTATSIQSDTVPEK